MDSIKVAIKVRPLIKREKEEHLPIQWAVQDNSIAALDPELKKRGEPFYFDHIFDTCQTNYDVFNVVAKPIIDAAINGINGTIFAYGQTSSGKTFTMMGEGDRPGVIPLAIDYIFDKVTSIYNREFLLRVSYIEIYNEKINDLLDKNRVDLKIKEEKNGQAIVVCKEEVANCSEMVLAIMRKGLKNRRIGETNMNERSSRSHTIFRITIESRESDSDGAVQISQLNLVDLAGSERPKQSGATGDRFNEGRHINMSLSALGLVIMQLSETQDNPQRYVNFRDSKLTRILQTSLGGNAMTTIICAVTPAALEETQCTLAFASRAKRIKNKPQVNECVSDAALLKRYAKQVAKLRAELEKTHAVNFNLVEMESKLMEKESILVEKDRAYQLLKERIELLSTRIVSGNNAPDDDKLKRRLKRRRTWCGPGTLEPKPPPFSLPTIKEAEKSPEKKINKDHVKRRQSIIQSLDIPNETFQTAFTDFELELIECERSRARMSDGSSGGDDASLGSEFLNIGRPRRMVQFKDDVDILDEEPKSPETTPEKNISESSSPGTPRNILKTRMNFLMEQYNALRNDHRSLEEFTRLEKQLFVEEAVEAAMIEHDETVKQLQRELTESEKARQEILDQFTKLQNHSSESDKRLDELQQQLAESANSLRELKSEKDILFHELDRLRKTKNPSDIQTSSNNINEKETSSIFSNNTYFEEMNVSDPQCDTILTNDTQIIDSILICDSSIANNTTISKLSDSKKSKDITNASYSEFMKQIGDKSGDELARLMQDLFNAKISLEEENTKLESTLRKKIRESDDVKNDIRELKSGIEKLHETIHILTTENTELASKLTTERESARDTENSLRCTITELESKIRDIAQEKAAMESTIAEFDEKLKLTLANEAKKETLDLLSESKSTVDSLTSEDIEISTNLMIKIEELNDLKDLKAAPPPPGDHECAYRESMKNLSELNAILKSDNLELSKNLMKKIEENDRLREEHEITRCKTFSSLSHEKSYNLLDISMNLTNLMSDEISANLDLGQTTNKTNENTDERANEESMRVQLSSGKKGSTIDDLLQLSINPEETFDRRERKIDESHVEWKLKAEILREQVENLTLLNEKLSDLRTTSCKKCAHLAELKENPRILRNEVKMLDRTLEELQTKFDREFADTEILRTKASEDINLSVCDASFNASINHDGGINVSCVEERVRSLHNEIEALRAKHEKISNLYREKCDEIERLHDGSGVRESTSPATTRFDSPRLRRDDPKLERIQMDMEKLQNDIRRLKNRVAGTSSTLQKFVNEKTIMLSEIEALRNEKREYEEKLRENELLIASKSNLEERIEDMLAERANNEKDQANLSEISKISKQLQQENSDLTTNLETLKIKFEEVITDLKDRTEENVELTKKLKENELLIASKSNLEGKIEDLLAERANIEKDQANLSEISQQLQQENSALTTNFETLKIKFEEVITDLKDRTEENVELTKKLKENELLIASQSNLEDKIKDLLAERANIEKDQANLSEISKQLQQENSALTTNFETLKIKFEEVITDLKDRTEENVELTKKLKENELLIASKSNLEDKIEDLLVEKTNIEKDRTNLSEISKQLQQENSALTTNLETLKIKLDEAITDLKDRTEENGELTKKLRENELLIASKSNLEDKIEDMLAEKTNIEKDQANLSEISKQLQQENSALTTNLETLKIKLEEVINNLKDRTEENVELTKKLKENELLIASKSNLEDKIEDLLAEKTNIEKDQANLSEISKISKQLQQENSDLTTNSETLKIKLEEAMSNLKDRTEENVELTKKLRENELLIASKSNLEEKIEDLLAERTNIEKDRTNLSEISKQLQQENSALTMNSETLKIKLDEAITDLKDRTEENVELTKKLKENELLIASKSNLEEKIEDLLAERTNIEKDRTNLSEISKQLQQENSALTTNLETLKIKLEEAMSNLNERTKENGELTKKINELERLEEESSQEKFILTNEITSLIDEITDLREIINGLKETIRKLEESNSSLTLQFEKAGKSDENRNETKFDESSRVTREQYEKNIEELKRKLQEVNEQLEYSMGENVDMREQLTKLNGSKEESHRMRMALEVKVENLSTEKNEIHDTLTNLRATLSELSVKNASLSEKLENIEAKNEKLVSRESIENKDSRNNEKLFETLNSQLRELDGKLDNYSTENDQLRAKIVRLQALIGDPTSLEKRKIDETDSMTKKFENNLRELESARKTIRKEIISLKPDTDSRELMEKSTSELFGFFVTTIVSKEREVIKSLNDNFERDKRRLEESREQSTDAEKRAAIWSRELEAEIERVQHDMSRQETRNIELCRKIEKLEHLLLESNHENQMLNDKMRVLEADFNTLEIDLEKTPDSQQSSETNAAKERIVDVCADTREMELTSKLRLSEKRYKEKLDKLTWALEEQKTRNIDMSNNLEGLEASERQLRNIVDMRTSELARCNSSNERLQRELAAMTDSYDRTSRENAKNIAQIDEITCLLKSKCDKLSEYKTKLETILPDYEKLKEQADERQLRLEKYRSEIECLTTESEKNIAILKDRLDSEEIKSAGYSKQLAELTNRNTTLQMELVELRDKCVEMEIRNEKMAKKMRNSTSKIRAEEEMEDLRDRNRILERNLDGAGNRIDELQEIKTRLMKDLTDMRSRCEKAENENEELKNVLSSHRSSIADTIELTEKYENLLKEKNRVDMELMDKRTRLAEMEKISAEREKKNEELRLRNAELDVEMDDIVARIHELTKENSELEEKLYKIENSVASRETKSNELADLNRELETKVRNYSEEIEALKSQRDELRRENEKMAKASKCAENENSELRGKFLERDRGDSLSCCGDSDRSASPAIEAIRIDSKRRRSRNELFNLNRPLEVFATNDDDDDSECRCDALRRECSVLEKELAFKDAKIATLQLKIQSEIFPHMRKCKDLEEILASLTRKNKLLKAEIRQLQEARTKEMSRECERCRQWIMNKCDQGSQCMPESAPIYMSGTSSGIIDGHIKVQKLEKDKLMLKTLCRTRQKRIFDLEDRLKKCEKCSSTNDSTKDETSKDTSAHGTSSKSDATTSTYRQAMKENVSIVRGSQKQQSQLRRGWFK